jgi:hypothetical protein
MIAARLSMARGTSDSASADVFPAVHALALRGSLKQIPGDHTQLEAAGLVRTSPDGFTLTQAGYNCHRALLDAERATIDMTSLGIEYERFAIVARRVTGAAANGSPRASERKLAEAPESLEPILRRTAAVVPRFAHYIVRLAEARGRVLEGELEYAADSDVESILTVVRELEEDYLQTLARGYGELDI